MKDKDLSIANFLEKLQEEYIVAEIRHKIYKKVSDRKYWKRVMQGKQEKIEDICFRNKIDSIFTCEKVKREFYDKVYNETGLPNFIYKDEKQRYGHKGFPGLEQTDIENYYSIGSEVKVGDSSEYEIGIIKEVVNDIVDIDNYTPAVKIEFKDNEIIPNWYEKNIVTRIL